MISVEDLKPEYDRTAAGLAMFTDGYSLSQAIVVPAPEGKVFLVEIGSKRNMRLTNSEPPRARGHFIHGLRLRVDPASQVSTRHNAPTGAVVYTAASNFLVTTNGYHSVYLALDGSDATHMGEHPAFAVWDLVLDRPSEAPLVVFRHEPLAEVEEGQDV